MKFSLFLAISILVSIPALAGNLILQPVSYYGGIRVRAQCRLETEWRDCAVDTGGPATLTSSAILKGKYEVTGTQKFRSVGWEMECQWLKIPGTDFGGLVSTREVLSCPDFTDSLSPTWGMDVFEGRSFAFDFSRAELTWEAGVSGNVQPLRREKHFIVMPATLGGAPVEVAYDTGAPVTLVDQKFVDAHPEWFKPSSLQPSEMLIRRKMLAYELNAPLVMGGVTLSAPIVHAGDFSALTTSVPVILGANHLFPMRWSIDLNKNIWSVESPGR